MKIKHTVIELAIACSPNVDPSTINQIIDVESNYKVFAVNVNHRRFTYQQPNNLPEALALVQSALAEGHTVDIGLMQINSRNLPSLGLSITDAFDPCKNINAGGKILTAFYHQHSKTYGEGQKALLAALSSYNTGNKSDGFSNGYILRYLENQPNQINPEHIKAIGSSTAVALPTNMTPGGPIMNDTKGEDIKDATPDTGKLLDNAETAPVSVRQDVADNMGVFKESALSDEDIFDEAIEGANNE